MKDLIHRIMFPRLRSRRGGGLAYPSAQAFDNSRNGVYSVKSNANTSALLLSQVMVEAN
jgi:hypothetical protein